MRNLPETLRRNRTVIALFVLMVLLPASIFSLLMVRDVRSERMRVEYQEAERQRQIVRLAGADLSNWLFSTRPQSAISEALFRFQLRDDRIVLPDHELVLPLTGAPDRQPLASDPDPLTVRSITDDYFPRIQAFLRDFQAGRNSGAQFFVRLRALVVRLPGRDEGYVLGEERLTEYVNQRLKEFSAGERFGATLSIGNPRDNSAGPVSGAFALEGFPFFQIVFYATDTTASPNGRQQTFAYSMTLLVLVTLLGTIVVHRAMSQEVKLSRLRTDFVAAVSHEFRSPLSSILALSERLEGDRVHDPGKLNQYHQIIGQEARRLSALVTRLLNFAQIEEGKKAYSLERTELVDVAREAIRSCEQTDRKEHIELSGEDAAPLWAQADRTALQHCIQNLIENAVRYSPRGSAVTVHCARLNGGSVIEVRDRGIGIPVSEQRKIFEKFYRGEQASELNRQGVGIGLALVKHVVESHGGSVSVESEVGRGSRFRLVLPAVEA